LKENAAMKKGGRRTVKDHFGDKEDF